MQATALITDKDMHFSLQPVLLPDLQADDVLVKTAYSGVSIGTEFALIRNKISWGPFPICTGYMATGIVEAIGKQVTEVKPGDKVFVRRNTPFTLADGTAVSTVQGTHCSHIVTPVGGTHGLGILPEGAPMEAASMFVMPAVGFKGVDMAAPKLGQTVVVYGSGLIGLGVVAAASLRGCKVIAIDMQEKQLEMAKAFGADVLIHAASQDVPAALHAVCPEGADAVFECTGIPALVDKALALCKLEGKFIWQGNYGAAPIAFSFLIPHGKRLQTFFPCDDGYFPCRHAVIKHMTSGIIPWEKTITHHIAANEAPAMYDRINNGDKDIVGMTINWS
jgi:2-desacetyl-2-hydroxyethyl bacteriochlorophyllide A dehydrogenase